MSSVYQTASTL